jgi:hypothetical protein
MTKKFPYLLSILIVLTLAACGPAPTPTLSTADLASTAAADAWLAVTMTQAAMPTATPLPPTVTPMPTFTPFPTLPLVVATAVPATSATDVCNQPPPVKPKGALVQVKFINKSGGNVNLSFGMNTPNSQGECVTYSYTLGTFAEEVVTVLSGCYWAYGWVDGKEPSTAQTIDLLCVNDPSKAPAIWISTEVISFH